MDNVSHISEGLLRDSDSLCGTNPQLKLSSCLSAHVAQGNPVALQGTEVQAAPSPCTFLFCLRDCASQPATILGTDGRAGGGREELERPVSREAGTADTSDTQTQPWRPQVLQA